MLRDQGVSYPAYISQISCLLFLKMDEERVMQIGEASMLPERGRRAFPRMARLVRAGDSDLGRRLEQGRRLFARRHDHPVRQRHDLAARFWGTAATAKGSQAEVSGRLDRRPHLD